MTKSMLACCAALLAASSAAKADSCVPDLQKLAAGAPAKWSRLVFGLQNRMSAQMLAQPGTDRTARANLEQAVRGNAQSCRATAFALDRVLSGAARQPADLSNQFSKAAFMKKVRDAAAIKRDKVYHLSIPGTLRVGSGAAADNLGHHFTIEVTQGKTAAEARILAAFEGQYTLSDWMQKKGTTRTALGAGGGPMTLTQLEQWSGELESLLAVLKNSIGSDGQPPRRGTPRALAHDNASLIFKRLFGVSYEQMGMKEGGVRSGADTVKVIYGEFNTDTAACKAFIGARIKQKAGTCTGDLCV